MHFAWFERGPLSLHVFEATRLLYAVDTFDQVDELSMVMNAWVVLGFYIATLTKCLTCVLLCLSRGASLFSYQQVGKSENSYEQTKTTFTGSELFDGSWIMKLWSNRMSR